MGKALTKFLFILVVGYIIVSAVVRSIKPKPNPDTNAELKELLKDTKAQIAEVDYIFSIDTCVYETSDKDGIDFKIRVGVPCGLDHVGNKEEGIVTLGKTAGKSSFLGLNLLIDPLEKNLRDEDVNNLVGLMSDKKWVQSKFPERIYSARSVDINGLKGSKIVMGDTTIISNQAISRKWYVYVLIHKKTTFEFRYFVASESKDELNKIAGKYSVLFDNMIKKVSIK